MIRCAALERMCAHYPQLRYKRDHSIDAATEGGNRFARFKYAIAENGTYLSEELAFWQALGWHAKRNLGRPQQPAASLDR